MDRGGRSLTPQPVPREAGHLSDPQCRLQWDESHPQKDVFQARPTARGRTAECHPARRHLHGVKPTLGKVVVVTASLRRRDWALRSPRSTSSPDRQWQHPAFWSPGPVLWTASHTLGTQQSPQILRDRPAAPQPPPHEKTSRTKGVDQDTWRLGPRSPRSGPMPGAGVGEG